MCHLKAKELIFYWIGIRFCCHLLWGILIHAMKLINTFCTLVWTNMYLLSQALLQAEVLWGNEYSVSMDFILSLLTFPTSSHYLVSEQIFKTCIFISFKEWFQICCQILLHLSQDGKLNMAVETKVISIWFQLKHTWNILVFTSIILQWPLLSLTNASLEEVLLLGSIGES